MSRLSFCKAIAQDSAQSTGLYLEKADELVRITATWSVGIGDQNKVESTSTM